MDADIRSGGEAFLAEFDERGTRIKLLETELRAVHEQLDTVIETRDRLQVRVEQLTGRLDSILHESNAVKGLLSDVANKIVAQLNTVRSVRELRGVPAKSNEDPMPKIVSMGPKTA